MFYDFHIHTREYSGCAESPAEEICRTAMDKGLDGIALTEHDLWWPTAEFAALRERFRRLTIIAGAEYTSTDGHFLLFLPESEKMELPSGLGVLELLPEIHAHGGIVIWAHPFRWRRTIPDWLDDAPLDGMEVASNNMDFLAQTSALEIAQGRRMMMFRNSDAHHWRMLGHYGNHLPVRLAGTDDFIGYVKCLGRGQERT